MFFLGFIQYMKLVPVKEKEIIRMALREVLRVIMPFIRRSNSRMDWPWSHGIFCVMTSSQSKSHMNSLNGGNLCKSKIFTILYSYITPPCISYTFPSLSDMSSYRVE